MRGGARRSKANHDAVFVRAKASPAHLFLRRRPFGFLLCLIALGGAMWAPHAVRASGGAVEGAGQGHDLMLLAGVALILVVAQPALKWSLARTPAKPKAPRATGEIADEITRRVAR